MGGIYGWTSNIYVRCWFIFKDDTDFDIFLQAVNTTIWDNINIVINYQNDSTQYTYRNAYYFDKDHAYYSSIAWGGFTGNPQISMLAVGLYLNEGTEPGNKILQSISYFYDFELGCNHNGKSYTTGLGHHFPIHVVSHVNWWYNSKNIYDPVPGITLYTFFGGIENDAFSKFYKIEYNKNDQVSFKGINVPVCPSYFNLTEIPKDSDTAKKHLLSYIPFWRRMVNIEDYSIKSSEYTVYETIVRMALSSGLLLGNDEKRSVCKGIKDCPSIFPDEKLKNKSPRKDIKDLLGRWSIP